MNRIILVWLALVCAVSFAAAQSPVITQPYVVETNNASSTITVTNTFQQVWLTSSNTRGRAGCTLQNKGSNAMYVYFANAGETISNATIAKSVMLPSQGSNTSCNNGGLVLKGSVFITGTSGDAFYAAQQ